MKRELRGSNAVPLNADRNGVDETPGPRAAGFLPARKPAHTSLSDAGSKVVEPNRVLLIDDDPRIGDLVGFHLEDLVECTDHAISAEMGIRMARRNPPDVILLDVDMPGCDGFEACRLLRQEPRVRDVPIIFLTRETQSNQVARALDAGAADYITKPFVSVELRARVRSALRAKRQMDRLRNDALLDSLTGLGNRGMLDASLRAQVAEHSRHAPPFAFALIDLDHFKLINDSHGHMVGDEVLRNVGRCLRNNCRPYDVACRFGGEEFAILLRGTEAPEASNSLERVLSELRDLAIPTLDAQLKISASAGLVLVGRSRSAVSESEILTAADDALYVAKGAGRDQFVTVSLCQSSSANTTYKVRT